MMENGNDLPLAANLPRGEVPNDEPLLLASGSPRRAQLLRAAGYAFQVVPPDPAAECGICSRETPPEMVARLAYRKAASIAVDRRRGMVLAADTVADCMGQILGKPQDRRHAEEMLRLLRGRTHHVYTGVCLWSAERQRCVVDVSQTRLVMDQFTDEALVDYLDSRLWEGKAGAFGYQDGIDWVHVTEGSESNVVGLPMERLAQLLQQFDQCAQPVDTAAMVGWRERAEGGPAAD